MSRTPTPFSWPTALWIASGWLVLNAGLYAVLESLDQPPGRSGGRLSERVLHAFEERQLTVGATSDRPGALVRYRLMRPASPSLRQTYPAVLFLHGAGQRGTDNRQQLTGLPEQMAQPPWRDEFPCFFIAPQCPAGQSWSNKLDVLVAILREVVENHPVDRRRVYLTGLSMGGFGSWELAARHPELFAAVVPICGGGDPETAARIVNVPIWAVHGDADDSVPVERSRTMVEALRAAGGHPRYTELQGVGHDSWTQTYRDSKGAIPWMFRQVKAAGSRPPRP